MCGIAGLRDQNLSKEGLSSKLKSMTDKLLHRGPDDKGYFVDKGIGLGHTRLSILDLTDTGSQPMTHKESGVTIVFNGEVYNFISLRKELVSEGCIFSGSSDTEVVLKVYVNWGREGLKRCEGIFSFAIWDSRKDSLILSRDRLGIKPLFYSLMGDRLFFGSEIKSLLVNDEINRDINHQSFSEYLWYGNCYQDRTIYKDIFSLPPGHWLISEKGKVIIKPWWKIEEWSNKPKFLGTLQEATELVKESIDLSVKRQMVADVPIALFLSGGLDSSAIAASAVNSSSKVLNSFSAGFDFQRGINELPKARLVADYLGLNHREMHITGENLQDCIMDLVSAHDEPFADAANIPLFLMARELKGEFKVVLQGDGGDEMFAGYRRYSLLHNNLIFNLIPRNVGNLMGAFGNVGKRFQRILEAIKTNDPSMKMALLSTIETLKDPPIKFLNTERLLEISKDTDPFLAYKDCAERFDCFNAVDKMLLTDITLQLPCQFLNKVDRSTMAQGVEARVPLLDENIASLALSMPSKYKITFRKDKLILRNTLKGRLPPAICNQSKTGFGVPYQYWLKSSLYDFACDSMLDTDFCNRFGFNRNILEKSLVRHKDNKEDLGFSLWKIFQFSLWSKSVY